MELQTFSRFHPSNLIDITIFGITFFGFWTDKRLGEHTIALTVLGVKFQLTW